MGLGDPDSKGTYPGLDVTFRQVAVAHDGSIVVLDTLAGMLGQQFL